MCWSQGQFGKGWGISHHIIWDKGQSLPIWIPELSAAVRWHLSSTRDIYQPYTAYIILSSRDRMTRCKDIRILIIAEGKKFVVVKEVFNKKRAEIVFHDAGALPQFKYTLNAILFTVSSLASHNSLFNQCRPVPAIRRSVLHTSTWEAAFRGAWRNKIVNVYKKRCQLFIKKVKCWLSISWGCVCVSQVLKQRTKR